MLRLIVRTQPITRFGFMASIIAILSLSSLSYSQPPLNAQPRKVTDHTPVKPEGNEFTAGDFRYKSFTNAEGVVFRVEKYHGNKLVETRYVEEIYAKGYPAKEEIVTGGKNDDGDHINVTKEETVYRDATGGVIKAETYDKFDQAGVATSKTVEMGGTTTNFTRDPRTNTWVPKGTKQAVATDPTTKPITSLGVTRVRVGDAEAVIKGYIATIERRAGEMTAAYYYAGGQRTLEEAFRNAGVSSVSMVYADAWGKNGLGLFWSGSVKGYYTHHQGELLRSLAAIQKRGYAGSDEMETLAVGMRNWIAGDRLLQQQFEALVVLFTRSAVTNDKRIASDERIGALMTQVTNTKPYNSARYEQLKGERAREATKLDESERVAGNEMSSVKDAATKTAAQRLFHSVGG